MDIALLTTFLAPFLPFLGKLGEKAAEEAAKKLGVDSWEKAKAIWSKLEPKVEAKPAASEAATDVANNPEDEELQVVLRVQLKKLLEQDEALSKALAQIMESDSPAASGGTNINLQGHNTQTAGDNAQQIGQIGQARDITL